MEQLGVPAYRGAVIPACRSMSTRLGRLHLGPY